MSLKELFGGVARLARSLPGAADSRQARRGAGHTDLRVRGVHRPGTERMARALENRLARIGGVHRAEVNAVLGRVRVFHEDKVPVDDLAAAVAEVEQRYGHETAEFAPVPHPGDERTVLREVALVGADVAGFAGALLGRALRAAPLPSAVTPSLVLAGMTPRIRGELERRIGPRATDLVFSTGVTLSHTLAQEPTGLAIDALHRLGRLVENLAHQQAWHRGDDDLASAPGAFRTDPVAAGERPVPLPQGPVEKAIRTAPFTFAAFGATYAITRDLHRAEGLLVSGVPRAGTLGRDAFAIQFGRALASRGVLVRDVEALRRLDRVNLVVLDASVLATGDLALEEVVPLTEEVTAEEALRRAHGLIDLTRIERRHERDGWSAVRASPAQIPREFREWARACRDRGARLLLLSRGDEAVALVSVLPELDPLAEAVVESARKVGPVVVAGVRSRLGERLRADRTVPGGTSLAESVRSLQEEGYGVMLVSAREQAALAASDVGIGITGRSAAPAWAAHLLCGPDLAGACLVVDAVRTARRMSEIGVRIAALGATAGALLTAAGPAATADRRASTAVNTAILVAIARGAWAGVEAARRPDPVPQERVPWHAWSAEAVLSRLRSSTTGLSEDEATRRRPAEADGERDRAPGFGQLMVEELDNPLTPVLAVGAGLSAAVGSAVDALLIVAVLGVNAVVSGAQRIGADRALRRLVDLSAVRTSVRRPDSPEPVAETADRLVPGDVIALTAGDAVPADCRLLAAEALEVDESGLTGESQPVAKSARPSAARAVADRHSMLYEGTVVAAGDAVAVVVATGERTEVGRTMRARAGEGPRGGVEARLRELTAVTLPLSLGAGAVLMVGQLLRGRSLAQALGPAVALTVGAVPEGLPFLATAAQLATARRLSRHGVLVRDPTTIEPLGRVDVLCFDKTGTLTEGRLRLRLVSDGVESAPVGKRTRPPERMRPVIAGALRANPERNGSAKLAHPTDRAVARGAKWLDMAPDEGVGAWERVDELPFEPGRGYHAVLGRTPGGQLIAVKGAPEVVLERCDTWTEQGRTAPFDARARATVAHEVERLARQGYRVLAVAERAASDRSDLEDGRIRGLRLLGLVGISDPVRSAAAGAVERLASAGVRVVMVTGDHPSTAEAVAAELGLLDGRTMTGAELAELSDEALTGVVSEVSVFARVSPEQKARIVRALHEDGHVVAVTGDGANDAPAIRLADVGIALGTRATPAARAAASVVVTDNRIETIAHAIADSRAMWRSTRNALSVLLGGNLGEVAFTVGAGLLSGTIPLNVRQLLLVNLLTDMLPSIALATRRPYGVREEELLDEGPEQSLGSALNRDIVIRSVTTASAALTAWLLGGAGGQANTAALVALVGAQLAQTVAAGGRDPVVLASGAASFAVLGAIVQWPGASRFFGCRPLTPYGWLVGLGASAGFAVAASLLGRWLRDREERREVQTEGKPAGQG
ncbi:cation-translocating P-type ATPase [Thermobifida alba]